ncbi:arabinose-5-phosphate isomerase [Selenomonas ruminantium]|uniref:Arabinose-5-phosphate isomerase n=1 Tax=Selenomonas ruminantium TaxID=971 RepID=A0A1M6TT42_SELRU|nr:KpsF/GutQ family sugar-phosphate isomerase [Selenomonas ruminantium]SHK60070.1 arabinose-5-phosphate isomerase [Selenomonas ruminantium]
MVEQIKQAALETLSIEAAAVEKLKARIDGEFVAAVQCILDCKARVVVTGMGKSGHIGRKMAATFASTGTPAFFMHPAEAFHGDLGMVTENDVVIAISNSGESTEVVNILPVIHRIGAKIIAMCGRRDSQLGQNSDYFVNIGVEKEACPLGLAPTASTTATLAMGDAMAIALMSVRDFTSQDFALFHPGGALGRKLLLTVKNVMHTGDENPIVHKDKTAKDALFIMTDKGLGAASVIDDSGKLVGIITDGIIRRALAKDYKFLDEAVGNIMFGTPLTIKQEAMASSALSVMEKHKPRPVTVLPVIDGNNVPVGIIHLTDLLRQGVV